MTKNMAKGLGIDLTFDVHTCSWSQHLHRKCIKKLRFLCMTGYQMYNFAMSIFSVDIDYIRFDIFMVIEYISIFLGNKPCQYGANFHCLGSAIHYFSL